MFTLTGAAAQQIQQAATASEAQDLALRVAAQHAADGSIEYGMGFDEAQGDDMRLMLEGVAVVIADPHQPLLEDTVLDFVELEPGEFSFIFIPGGVERPPVAKATSCGGGSCDSCGG
jgi:iron-sulfur cluster assembly protein